MNNDVIRRKTGVTVNTSAYFVKEAQQSLSSFGLSYDNVSDVVVPTIVSLSNRTYHGVSFKNLAGGIEFFSPTLPLSYSNQVNDYGIFVRSILNGSILPTISIYHSSFSLFPASQSGRSRICCVFLDFLDYLAFLSLRSMGVLQRPVGSDCLVLNSYSEFPNFILELDFYDKIYSFLPFSLIGRTMDKTLRSRHKSAVHQCVTFYRKYSTLKNYLIHQKCNNQ